MTEFILKTFTKNNHNLTEQELRRQYGVTSGAVGILSNIFLFVIKLISGIFSSSVSIIADGINNLSDALSSIIAIAGFKLSGKKPDIEHPFGHGRAEYVSALFVSVVIGVMGFELLKSSFVKILNPETLKFSILTTLILIISILIKFWLYVFYKKTSIIISSEVLKASSKDSLSDCVATSAVLFGLVLFRVWGINADGYIGVGVSGFILYTAYITLKDSLSPLLGIAPTKELVDKVRDIVLSYPEIIGMHDLIIHNYGPTRFMITLHAEVRADRDVLYLHEKIDSLERCLNETLGCESVIHMDPVEPENEEVNRLREKVVAIIGDIDESLSVHDFRVVKRTEYTNLIFDVTVPFGFRMSTDQLDFAIKNKTEELGKEYRTVVEYDNSYI